MSAFPKSVTAVVPAKINLALCVGGVRRDHFHELATVYQAVSLFDEVEVTRRSAGSGIRLSVEGADVVIGSRSKYRALEIRDKLIREIDAILLPHFDIEYASLLVLGRNAREATPQQRSRFAKAFYNSIAHRYAEGLLNYTRGNVRV